MNDPTADHIDDAETEKLLERFAETFPDRPAPLPTLLRAARQAKRRRTRRVVAASVAAVVVVVGGGAAGLSAMGSNDRSDTHRSDSQIATDPTATTGCTPGGPPLQAPVAPQGPDYPTNANGLTYGARSMDEAGVALPDLLAVVGDCGLIGYVHRSDLNEADAPPPTPGAGAGSGEPQTFKVFESDGVTQIDTYTRGRGQSGTPDEMTPTDGTSPGVEGTDREAPVAHDLNRLADAFVMYAVGDSDSFPHWESVSLAIGGETVVSIDDFAASLPNRDIWKRCPAGADMYGAASCPVDLLGPIKAARVNGTPLVFSSKYRNVTCAPARLGPLPAGRLVVITPAQDHRTCASDFALALVADEQGRLRSVDLTLSSP